MSVLNIVELQNVVTSASGLTPVGYLSNQVTNIQQMVDFGNKQINVNAISNFDTTPIQVLSGLNLCNVTLSYNGTAVAGSNVATTTTSIGTATTGVLTLGISTGAGLTFTQSSMSTFVIGADSNATFSGTVTAAGFITASDSRLKGGIKPITDYETILSAVDGVRFKWKATGTTDVGVIAQDVLPVLPEAVHEADGLYRVDYAKFIPVLIQSVKALQARVAALESASSVVG